MIKDGPSEHGTACIDSLGLSQLEISSNSATFDRATRHDSLSPGCDRSIDVDRGYFSSALGTSAGGGGGGGGGGGRIQTSSSLCSPARSTFGRKVWPLHEIAKLNLRIMMRNITREQCIRGKRDKISGTGDESAKSRLKRAENAIIRDCKGASGREETAGGGGEKRAAVEQGGTVFFEGSCRQEDPVPRTENWFARHQIAKIA
jgi:hypothetical protein